MKLPPNQLKAALAHRTTSLGLWSALGSAYSTEIIACSGYNWITLDMEHSPNDMMTVLAQMQMLAAYQVEPVVRLVRFDKDLIKQYLDLGARTIVLPNIETAEEARAIVAATRYPASGIRGVAGMQRANRWGRVPNYHQTFADELCIMAQIESVAGVANAKSIAQVDGIDGLFVGPNDLAASLGHLMKTGATAVQEAIAEVQAKVFETRKGLGILASNHTDALRYIKLGYSMVGLGADQSLLAKASDELLSSFRKLLAEN